MWFWKLSLTQAASTIRRQQADQLEIIQATQFHALVKHFDMHVEFFRPA
jgi:hypothetical protein